MNIAELKPLDALQNPIFRQVGEVADELGLECYVVGGFVRDFFLGREQSTDIDFVAVGSGIELARAVQQHLQGDSRVKIFKNYGTAMVRHGRWELEFVGARKESYREDSRKPLVEDGTLEDDQNRRDFTINALAICLNSERFGELVDPFGGINDLESGLLRTPLDPLITFSDDPLRMLRAIRFAGQLGFEIHPDSFHAIRDQHKRLKIVSVERITTELQKIMATDRPSKGFALLYRARLLELILPELTALQGIEEIEGQRHKDNFWHTLEVVDNLSAMSGNLWHRWAALLHDIGKARTKRFDPRIGWTFHGHEYVGSKMVYKVFRRLKLPMGDPLKYVQKLVAMSSRPIGISDDHVTDSAVRRLVFDAGDDIDDLITLCEADITTKNPRKQKKYLKNFQVVRQKIREVEERDRIRNFQPPISGEEIMHTFDLQPSREIGEIKEAIKEAILEGEIPNEYDAAREFMIRKAGEMGISPAV